MPGASYGPSTLRYTLQAGVCGGFETLRGYRRTPSWCWCWCWCLCWCFWGPGLLICGPFWMIWGPFWVSVWGLGVEGCRQQLKTSKTAPLLSGLPVLPKKCPPFVLAVRCDLLVFPYPKSSKNTQITTYSEQRRRTPVWLKGQTARDVCCF